jgi:hypothetical protein
MAFRLRALYDFLEMAGVETSHFVGEKSTIERFFCQHNDEEQACMNRE